MRFDKQTEFDQPDLSFDEIDRGFTAREAIAEAKRCLNCAKPMCRTGCPIENEIPLFVAALAKGNIGEAGQIIARREPGNPRIIRFEPIGLPPDILTGVAFDQHNGLIKAVFSG